MLEPIDLEVARRRNRVAQPRLDILPQGQGARYVESADVRGTSALNRLPLVVANQVREETALEVVRLAPVDGFPEAIEAEVAEHVHAVPVWPVLRPYRVHFEAVRGASVIVPANVRG